MQKKLEHHENILSNDVIYHIIIFFKQKCTYIIEINAISARNIIIMPTDDKNDTSSSPTDALSGQLDRTKEIEKKLKKMELLLDIARRCNLNITDVGRPARPIQAQPQQQQVQPQGGLPTDNTAYGTLMSAYRKFYVANPDLNEVYEDLSYVNYALTRALQAETTHIIPSKKYLSFQSMLYGITPMIISIIAAVIFSSLLWLYGLHGIPPVSVPLWAALFGGLGACVQILIGLVADIRADGVVSEYKRIWYMILPIVALIFGYLAYVFADLGVLTLGGGQGGQSASVTAANISLIKATGANTLDLLNNAAGNYSFTAKNVTKLTATGVGSFTSNTGDSARVVLCFLAGYGTDAFIKRLTNLAEKM
jgi:hypothetical protein